MLSKHKTLINICFCCHVCHRKWQLSLRMPSVWPQEKNSSVETDLTSFLHSEGSSGSGLSIWTAREKTVSVSFDLVYSCPSAGRWHICLFISVNEKIEKEVEEYEERYRGRELPGFINYKTFEFMVKEQIKQLEEPAVKRLKDIAGIWSDVCQTSCVFLCCKHFYFILYYHTTTNGGLSRLQVAVTCVFVFFQMLWGRCSYSWPRAALLDFLTLWKQPR